MDYSGQQFEHYQLIEKLGRGGMATVYKAYDTRLERDVAIKVVRKESIPPEHLERILKRFEREAKALAKFIHPNIVPVHDFGEFQGAPFLVMAYLPGGTLKERIGKPVPVQAALGYVIPIASALNYAHQRGVVHRDVKPSNILITEDGTLMLSDFGIARILEETTTQLTATGMGVGTPEYMAPEQWQGKAGPASDQYALGVVFYELLTGQKPFSAETPLAVALKVMSESLPRPSGLVPEIPEEVEKVLYKTLARDPQDRYESMEVFHKTLIGFDEKPVSQSTKKLTESEDNIDSENEVSGILPGHDSAALDQAEIEDETVDKVDLTPISDIEPLSIPYNKPNNVAGKNVAQVKKTKKKTLFLGLSTAGVLCLVSIFCILGGLGILGVRNYNERNAKTTTAQAQETATAKVGKTATAQAQATGTAQSVTNIYDEYVDTANLVYEEQSGSLEHEDDDLVRTHSTGIESKNFALEITFQNPYDSSIADWDYGIIFRHSGSNDQYRLFVTSSSVWMLKNREDSEVSSEDGHVELNTGEGEKNTFKILSLDTKGYFFINEQFVTELDLSERDFSGYIMVGTGFMNGHEVEGYSTQFENLIIYKIDDGNESTTINEKDGAEMVYVPAGEFLMGSDDSNADDDESPEHTVYLDAYWIYKYEVTNEQYAVFLNAMGNQTEGGVTWLDATDDDVQIHQVDGEWVVDDGYEEYPVIELTWYGAQAYCEWAGGSLPTEAQWEKAARGEDGITYPWGDNSPTSDLANYGWNIGETAPVGSYPSGASPYGALDMAGNVWEWVADWYDADYYENSPLQNPTGPASGTYRVLRGGSWNYDGRYLRASSRNWYIPVISLNNDGFRCVPSPDL